jgi:hypothetical protein
MPEGDRTAATGAGSRIGRRKLDLAWEQIWEQDSTKQTRTSATRCNRPDTWAGLTSAFATLRAGRNTWQLAHNPEVAGLYPVPATR